MRILYLVDLAYPDHMGGSHRLHYEAARRLAGRGHDVHLVTAQPGLAATLPAEEDIAGVHYHRFARDHRRVLAHAVSYASGPRRIFARLAAEGRFDVISAHYALPCLGVLSSPIRAGTPIVYTLHAVWADEFVIESAQESAQVGVGRRAATTAIAGAMRLLEWWAVRSSKRVHVLSRFMAGQAQSTFGCPPTKLAVIPGGVDGAVFNDSLPRGEARRRLGLPQDRPLLLSVRRLYARMGLENLVQAMASVVQRHPQALLLIGGRGPLQGELERAIVARGLGENVRLLGYVADEALPMYYRAADLFVLPTAALEGFGLATLEALACGTPVLGTPVGGTVDILRGLDVGLLFRSPSPEDMAAGISAALDGPERLPSSDACRRHVVDNYSWERMVDGLEALFASVCS
jgi:glycosyltransferase involved in cell wall biosynthesis